MIPENKRSRINITNVWIDPIDIEEAAQRLASFVYAGKTENPIDTGRAQTPGAAQGQAAANAAQKQSPGAVQGQAAAGAARSRFAHVCTPNAEFMMDAQRDGLFMRILNEADMVVADGAGVVMAARLLGYGKIARAPGFDLVKKLVTNPDNFPFSYFFLGGKPGVAEKASVNILNDHPETRISGCHDGFFGEADEALIIDKINKSGADVLFVAMGAPKAEKWIYKNRENLKVSVCIGVGGTIDILAGEKKPAPPFFRSHGLEWLYRLSREPWRAKRMLKLPQYIIFTIWWKLAGKPGAE